MTDSGLLRWLWERHRGSIPGADQVDTIRQRFMSLLHGELATAPHRFAAIGGAASALDEVRAAGWSIAIATGGWEPSARLKLETVGIDHAPLAFASGSDAEARVDILRLAACRAMSDVPDRVVSIGDGVWDVAAARELGWPFVGVATGAQADRLRAAGATTILPDLGDAEALRAALDTAIVPPAS